MFKCRPDSAKQNSNEFVNEVFEEFPAAAGVHGGTALITLSYPA
jgi:hypothetical protein